MGTVDNVRLRPLNKQKPVKGASSLHASLIERAYTLVEGNRAKPTTPLLRASKAKVTVLQGWKNPDHIQNLVLPKGLVIGTKVLVRRIRS